MNLVDMAWELIKVNNEWAAMGVTRNSDEVMTMAYTVVGGGLYRPFLVTGPIHCALADSRAAVVRFNREYLEEHAAQH